MKVRTTKRKVMNETWCISVPYCALQDLLTYESPIYYTTGVYGWNADVYMIEGLAIVTGYRPFGNIKVDYSVIEKYEQKAKEIKEQNCYTGNTRAELYDLIREFVRECKGNRV